MDFLEPLIAAYGSENGGDLVNKVVVFLMAWFMVRKEMRKQFHLLTDEVSGLKKVVAELSASMRSIESSHELRISSVEADIKSLKKGEPNG